MCATDLVVAGTKGGYAKYVDVYGWQRIKTATDAEGENIASKWEEEVISTCPRVNIASG